MFRADMVAKGCREVEARSLRDRERITDASLFLDLDTIAL